MQTLRTERLLLRPFTLDDAEAYRPLVSDPAVLRHTGEVALTSIQQVRDLIRSRPLRDYATYGFGRMACIEHATGRLVGFSGLKYLDDLREVDIGYRFLPDCWGKGYATESARRLMLEGWEGLGIERVIGLVEPANAASVHVLKKVGLAFESEVTVDGHEGALHQYATPGTRHGHAFKPAQRHMA